MERKVTEPAGPHPIEHHEEWLVHGAESGRTGQGTAIISSDLIGKVLWKGWDLINFLKEKEEEIYKDLRQTIAMGQGY